MKQASGSLPRVRLSAVLAGSLALLAVSLAPAQAAAGAGSGPVEPGVPYYLVATKLDRGLTAEGDSVRYTNSAGDRGIPVVFEKDDNSTWGEGYQIRMQRRGSTPMLCHSYERRIVLMDSCRQNPWMLVSTGDSFRVKTRWDGSYLFFAASPAFPNDKALYWKDQYGAGDLDVMEFKAVKAR
ncbi:hypothetical protein M1P56_16150 [Streptomyces sp. HU2014]|uniref:hypothetical protein n=1 Tax=Streptomyces sp. HU2014 TaxID=2939414 RepID=UPI00200D954A|nr:hypothetical protein [Streptomyces sp. HU2014]UQI45776.1 hypothetical protein M1P56_16150 [Streptomyces sp. HU2014]